MYDLKMMRQKFVVFGLCLIILSSILSPLVYAYQVVVDGSGSGAPELNCRCEERYSRTFYSNYSNRFYSIYTYLGMGYPAQEIHYSSSVDGITWTNHQQFLTSDSRMLHTSPAIYLHPDGRFIEYCYESYTDDDSLYWGRKEILLNGSIVNNITSTCIINGDFGQGQSRANDEYSLIVDSEGFIYIGFESVSSTFVSTFYVIKSLFNNGTWNHEQFGDVWNIESEWIDNGGANPPNDKWGGRLFPLHETEDAGLVFYYCINSATQEIFSSMYYDNSTDDWIGLAGGLFYDNEGGGWADEVWTLGYSDDIAVFFMQHESNPDGFIGLEAKFLNVDTNTWENQTQIGFDVVADEGGVKFMPLVSVNEEFESINFIWSIVGNDTIWYRRMYPNHTLEDIGILESNLDNVLIEDNFNSHPRSFSPMGVSWWVDESSIPEFQYSGDFILHNYLTFLDDNWSIPYGHYNTTLYNSDGSINDGWIFRAETYKFVSYFYNASLFHLNFTDGEHEIVFSYNNATQRLSVDSDDQFIVGSYYFNITEYLGGIVKAEWGFIPNTNIVDIEDTLVYYYLYNEELDSEQTSSTGISFNIYNLGGFTYYTFEGDGGRTQGGSPFQIYATDGSTNSRARAEQVFRKLQHINFLIEIDMDNEWESGNGEFDIDAGVGYLDIGFDYRLNGTWVEGFFIRLYIQDADVGHHDGGIDHDWLEWKIDFHNYNPTTGDVQHLATQIIYSNHWGYEHENYDPDYYNRTSCQLWIDLWFDKANASTTIASQVNAYYHGLREQGNAWWFGYGTFVPMISDYDNAKFLDDLYDEGGNVTNCQKFDLIRFFIEVNKVNIADGNDETWTVRAIEDMHRQQAIDRMEGIDEPTFVQTKVLDMPQTGFINAIKSALGNIANSISQGIFFTLKSLWAGVGWVAELMGLKDWYDALSIMISNISIASMNFMEALEIALINSALLLEQVLRLFTTGIVKYVTSLSLFITAMLSWYTAIAQMFSGGGVWSIDIWMSLSLGDWVGLLVTLSPVLWLNRLNNSDDWIATAQGDITFVIWLVTGLFHFLSMVIMLSLSLMNFLIGLLPI
ncbi:hypothetical protein ES702_00722 [subsurface metagenome]